MTPEVKGATATGGLVISRWIAAVALAVILGAAFLLRAWSFRAGIPYAIGIDEPEIMNRVVVMMKTGDLNPHFFDWPSLAFYLHFVWALVTFVAGAVVSSWPALGALTAADLYPSARLFSALAGTATVWLTFLAGRRWGRAAGLIAAALMAVVPHHVRESHYVLADVPTALFTTLVLVLSLRAHEHPTFGRFAWAGACAGLAASCKYNGGLSIVMPMVAAIASPGAAAVLAWRILAIAGPALAGFVAGTPYAVLDLPKFLADYARLATIFAGERADETGWTIYPKHLLAALGWPALAAAMLALVVTTWRGIAGPGRARAWLLAAFPIVYFVVMARSYQVYGRYTLPLLPVASVLAGISLAVAIDYGRTRAWPRRVLVPLAILLLVGVLATPAATSIAFDERLGRTSTIDLAYAWITANVPPGTRFASETLALRLPPRTYPTEVVASLTERTADEYAARGVQYLLAASDRYGQALAQSRQPGTKGAAYLALFADTAEVASFTHNDDVPGPDLRVFRVR